MDTFFDSAAVYYEWFFEPRRGIIPRTSSKCLASPWPTFRTEAAGDKDKEMTETLPIMSSSTTFSRFPDLPAELRLKIWDEALNGPSMHVFDVCFPSWRGAERSKRAFQDSTGNISEESQKRWSKYSQCVFLDAVESGSAELSRSTRVARHAHDPSVYKLRRARRLTSAEASAASAGRRMGGTNTVYLPGRNERVVYNNDEDVLFLRFRDGGALTELSQGVLFGEYEASGANNLSEVLEGPWSAEMATTLHGAGKIALDVAETWTPATVGAVLLEEVAYLGCCLQQGLRVLYLVDHCPGRCARCNRTDKKASRLQSSGALYKQLHGDEVAERAPDVIRGVGKTYRELFDLEGLGWSDSHPSYVFARAMNETIRSQQADADAKNFQGVRVLVVEDDKVDSLDTTTLMDCNPEDAPEKMMDKVWEMSLRWSS